MGLGVVAQPQLERVHTEFVSQLVQGALQREVPLRLAGGAHRPRTRDVEPHLPVPRGNVGARIRPGRPYRDRLYIVVLKSDG